MRISGLSVLIISIMAIDLCVRINARPIERQHKRSKKEDALELCKNIRKQLSKTSGQYWKAVKSHLTPSTKQKPSPAPAVRQMSYYEIHKNITSLPPVIEVFSTGNISTEVELMKTLDALRQVNHTLSEISGLWISAIAETCIEYTNPQKSICTAAKCIRHSHRKAELALRCRLETMDLPRLVNLIKLVENEVNKTQCKHMPCLQQRVDYVKLGSTPQNNVQMRALSVIAVFNADLQIAAVESGLKKYLTLQAKSKTKQLKQNKQ